MLACIMKRRARVSKTYANLVNLCNSLRLKLHPKVARKMLLEAHRWTGTEALQDGVVDAIAELGKMFDVAMELARTWAPKGKMDVMLF